MGQIVPNLNFEGHLTSQTTQQRMSGPDTWELELLGEDSLWANIPILSNFISVQDSPPYEYVSSHDVPQPLMNPTLSGNGQFVNGMAANGTGGMINQVPKQHSSDQSTFLPADEITLLRHFVDFAVPPILIGVEPRWNSSRDALLRLSKSNLPLRHAICAFSALSLEEAETRTSSARQSSTFYSTLAMTELNKLLDEQANGNARSDSQESILASIFFLSYVELIVSNAPKRSVYLLDRAHALLSNRSSSASPLYNQLQIWLKLLDAKVVSAGGKGIHLHTNPDTQDLDIVRESYDSSVICEQSGVTTPILETEEILFNSLNRPSYNFYVQVLNFSGRIARLDKWHRSRGSVQDELEVMLAADKVIRDLNALWTRRPAIIDLADQREQLRQYLAPSLATKVEHHLRTYTANYYACFIHLQRVAYAHLKPISQIKTSVAKIVHLSRLTVDEGHALPVSMLWPLMMAACEAEDEETQNWIINCIEGMKSKVGNAMRTAKLVREIVKRQKSGQRADARTVMHEAFGAVFAII
ncbi:uncharacterized protein PV09_08623 [Verruconis gallopava]|uniref:Transcription factor domain-containing protein n=1 Tax=Verruconis gallopava TaxID=253628 RepID=A0A0D2A0H0_9PEZI|nr:uncharacterized protein PV09_08623 [Verruconis gallopava]KIV99819.1 hypothetical protein PV09_08623 [Verruconis gallopava]